MGGRGGVGGKEMGEGVWGGRGHYEEGTGGPRPLGLSGGAEGGRVKAIR